MFQDFQILSCSSQSSPWIQAQAMTWCFQRLSPSLLLEWSWTASSYIKFFQLPCYLLLPWNKPYLLHLWELCRFHMYSRTSSARQLKSGMMQSSSCFQYNSMQWLLLSQLPQNKEEPCASLPACGCSNWLSIVLCLLVNFIEICSSFSFLLF